MGISIKVETNGSAGAKNVLTKEEIAKTFYEIEGKKAEADKQLNSILSKKEEAENKIKKFENEINALSSEYRVKESRLKFLEETDKRWDIIKDPEALLFKYFSYPDGHLHLKLPDKTIVFLSDIELDDDIKNCIEMLKVLAQNIIKHEEEKNL